MSPATAALLADAILLLHVGVVVFVVGLLPLVLVGGWRGWGWVRNRWLRSTHLGLMVLIALQAWLGRLCPLTIWEQALRRMAGQASYSESFITYWLGRLLYVDAPLWLLAWVYSGFALLVVGAWWWVRPVKSSPRGASGSTH